MRVLITGVSGFVGRHLAAHCRRSAVEVVGVGRTPVDAGLRRRLDDFALVDLGDAEPIAAVIRATRPDHVFHLAGQASVDASWSDPTVTIRSNFTTALQVLEAVRREAPDAGVLISGSRDLRTRLGRTAPGQRERASASSEPLRGQ